MEEVHNDIVMRLHTTELLSQPPPGVYAVRDKDYCTVRMVARTKKGLRACAIVDEFYPYFFLELPEEWDESYMPDLKSYIMEKGRHMFQNLVSCTLQYSHATYGFTDGKLFPFAKLSFRGEKSMRTCMYMFQNCSKKRKLRDGVDYEAGECYPIKLTDNDDAPVYLKPCEHQNQIPNLLKTIHDTFIQPNGWVEVSAHDCVEIPNINPAAFDICFQTRLNCIKMHDSDDIPKFKECSFDGEMISHSYNFPVPRKPYDCVAQLGVEFNIHGAAKPYLKILFCLGEMGDLSADGVEVRCSATERELLMDFVAVLIREDPDILTGYNINKFDIPYLIKRAELLGLPDEFFVFGRFLNEKTELVESFRSKLKGNVVETKKQYNIPIIPGRRIEDCMEFVKNAPKKLTSYKLDFVANYYLGVGKNPVEAEDIFHAYGDTTSILIAEGTIRKVNDFLARVRVMRAFDLATRKEKIQDDANVCKKNGIFALSYIESIVCSNWPEQYRKVIKEILNYILMKQCKIKLVMCRGETAMTYDEASSVINDYVQMIQHTDGLFFEDQVDPVNIFHEWYDGGGITIENLDLDGSFKRSVEEKTFTPANPKKRTAECDISPKKSSPSQKAKVTQLTSENRDEGYYVELFLKWERRVEAEVEVLSFLMEHRTTRKFAEKWWNLTKEIKACKDEKIAGLAQEYLDAQIKKHRQTMLDEKTVVGRYCMQDASLPIRIRNQQQHLISLLEMSKATSVPCNMLIEKGQTIKVINMILLWARKNNYVVTVRILPQPPFVGGEVLTPEKGFYKELVFTLDYNSLYPSLIQANMLCYLSLILPGQLQKYVNRKDLQIREDIIGEGPNATSYHWVTNKRTCLPEILHSLVTQRCEVKEELENETDPQRKIILHERQLALKLSGNSVYGFTGYEHSPWPCMAIAVTTTDKGRKAIHIAKKMAEDKYKARVIYGDSVTGDTPVLIKIRMNNREVMLYMCIEDILRQTTWTAWHNGKEYATPFEGMEVWSDKGFTPVKKIIRHHTSKSIYAVSTSVGFVKVTEDHSLLSPAGQKLKPCDVVVGTTPLLHAELPCHMLNKDVLNVIKDSLKEGDLLYYSAESVDSFVCHVRGQLASAQVFFCAERLNYSARVRYLCESEGGIFEIKCQPKRYMKDGDEYVVQSMVKMTGQHNQYVYDLETENHHFAAGVGKMVVHNTDSVMCIVPIPSHITSVQDKMEYVFRIAKEAAAYITTAFDKPMKLAFEKVYYPYLLCRKKGYSGLMWTKSDKPDKIDTKGIEAIRRDNCPLLRNTMIAVLETLAKTMDVSKAWKVAQKAFKKLADQDATWEELTVTKKLGEDYKNQNQLQLVVAEYLQNNHPLLAPEVGDRVPFCFIKIGGQKKSDQSKAYLKAFNPVLAERQGKEPDWLHYCEKCLLKPFNRIFSVAYGHEYQKNGKNQATDVLWEPYLSQIRKNDIDQNARIGFHPLPFTLVKKETELNVPLSPPPIKPVVSTKKTTPPPVKSVDIRSMFSKK